MSNGAKKTVLFYTDTPIVGGAENQMYILAKFLDKDKYEVVLVCSHYEHLNDWAEKFKTEGIDVMRLNVFHKHDPRHYTQLKDILRDKHVDLMHLHIWNPAACKYALHAGAKYNIPMVITEHDPFELSNFKKYIKTKQLENVSHVIAVSDANNKLLIKLYPELKDKVSTIHNGIDVTWFTSQNLSFNEDKINEYREKIFHSDEDTKIILTVAELHERKGLKYLIKAMPFVIDKHPNTKLIIVGSGPDRDELEKTVQSEGVMDNVMFLGFKKDIPHLMKAADIFVLPSIKEAFGLVIVEAMASEIPIIASNVGGIPEIIEDGVNGTLVPPENEDKLTEEILRLLENESLVEKYITAGNELLQKSFDAKSMALKTEEVYDKTLSKK